MIVNNRYFDDSIPESIEKHGKLLERARVRDFIPDGILIEKKNKGKLGLLVEEYHFGIQANNEAAPDFPIAGVELKVTPFKRNKSKKKPYSAKERLVLNMINYMKLPNENFYNSSFWTKNKLILLIFYLHEKGIDMTDFLITNAQLFEFPENDLEIIKKDWETIHNKVKNGQAYDLSESDTYYLAACTKGAGGGQLTNAPGRRAKPRAYSLKQSYMTSLLRNYILPGKPTYGVEGVDTSRSIASDIKNESLDEYIYRKYSPYFGRNLYELCDEFDVNFSSKSSTYEVAKKICSLILNSRLKNIDKSDEFVKSNTKIKAIRINKKGKIEQHMSFPAFKYKEIVNEDWESSTMKEYFEESRFLFVIFIQNDQDEYVFSDSFFWRMPTNDLNVDFKMVWQETVDRILEHRADDLPRIVDNPVAHVRPHGRKGIDTYQTHYGEELVKKSFWLNNTYILKQVIKHSHLNLN